MKVFVPYSSQVKFLTTTPWSGKGSKHEPESSRSGYSDSLRSFTLRLHIQERAEQVSPPSQPWFPDEGSDPAQSTTCCTLSSVNELLFLIAFIDSIVSIVENAQHAPHFFWFLTGDTTPLSLQSTLDGTSFILQYLLAIRFGTEPSSLPSATDDP